MKTNKKILSIYDFDGTLIRTELPETGRIKWEETTKEPFPHKGWWSKPESLDFEIFDNNPMNEISQFYEKDSKRDDTYMLMLTGRMKKLSNEVEKILDKNSFVFEKYMYNTGGSTISNKLSVINQFLEVNPQIDTINIYEDRLEHFKVFNEVLETFVNEKRLVDFSVVLIKD